MCMSRDDINRAANFVDSVLTSIEEYDELDRDAIREDLTNALRILDIDRQLLIEHDEDE